MAGADRGIARREPADPRGLHLVEPRHDVAAELAELRPHLARAALVDVAAALGRLLPAPRTADPRDERIRFHHTSDLGFHPGEVVAVDLAGNIATITTSLLGLCGVESPLPLYLLDDADRDDDPAAALRGLLDVVHHRLFSLLLRVLRERDLPESLHRDDRWLARLLALFGLRECPALPRPVLIDLLPVFAAGVRSPAMLAAALRLALGDLLGDAGVRVDPWTGGWLPIDPDQHTRLGDATALLGDTAVLGTEIFHPAGAATIVIGPLAGADTREFLPGGRAHARIAAVCRRFTAVRLDLAIELRSRPPALLDERRLGEDFWLGDDPDAASRHRVPLD
jgi:type VI secretion system protein ImpH